MFASTANKTSSVIEMERMDEEIVSPETFLNFSDEQRRDILRVKPLVNHLGVTDIEDPCFVALLVKWNRPKYETKL